MKAVTWRKKVPADGGMRRDVTLFLALAVIIVAAAGFLWARHDSKSDQPAAHTGCVAETLRMGSTGGCVQDAQTLINFMETEDLRECPFVDGTRLNANGHYDAATKQQVQAVQTWVNCYNHQEGSSQSIAVNGIVASPTWYELCSYGYAFASRSNSRVSPYRQAAVSAGRQANCPSLL
jgi:hypothetical protein